MAVVRRCRAPRCIDRAEPAAAASSGSLSLSPARCGRRSNAQFPPLTVWPSRGSCFVCERRRRPDIERRAIERTQLALSTSCDFHGRTSQLRYRHVAVPIQLHCNQSFGEPMKKTDTQKTSTRLVALGVMVFQRLDRGHGPGPITVYKTVHRQEKLGGKPKKVSVRIPLDCRLPAGCAALNAADRQAFSEQGLTGDQLAYVEEKLPRMKLASDVHKSLFAAEERKRKRDGQRVRIVQQLLEDSALLHEVVAEVGSGNLNLSPAAMVRSAPRSLVLSEKVRELLALMVSITADVDEYRDKAKIGKIFDKRKLQRMFDLEAATAWKLSWFAFSRMIDAAKATPFARSKGWLSDPELSELARGRGLIANKSSSLAKALMPN